MRNIIAVVSGKGGVGKSTVSANLAIALANTGAKVSLVDADFYGPSIPTMFGGGEIQLDHESKLIPPEKFGVKYISLGFFLSDPDEAVIWRGPMFNKALEQMFHQTNWGEVDYCIVDMPPGTGDAPLSLSQMVSLTGSIVVTTPQEVALADVRKAINMFSKVKVEVLGLIENMAGFVAPDGTCYEIFGKDGGVKTAEQHGIPLLASIPIDIQIREGGDLGTPVAVNKESSQAAVFNQLALQLIEIVDNKQDRKVALNIVN